MGRATSQTPHARSTSKVTKRRPLEPADAPHGVRHEGIRGVSITLNYDTPDEARRIFEALGEGGTVTMAMAPTFWAQAFGMLTDRFGTPWIVNGGMQPMP